LVFPERVYTGEEVRKAKELIDKGYRHKLTVEGNSDFKQKVEEALRIVISVGYGDFLRTYIRRITEIDGFTQLREADASIWANKYAVENPVDAASIFIQKANSMKEYLEGRLYYGGEAEKRSVKKRIEFLEMLVKKSKEKELVEEAERLLRFWNDSSLVY
jgi:hypothetical protein